MALDASFDGSNKVRIDQLKVQSYNLTAKFQMKTRQNSKKLKQFSKVALSTMSLQKTHLSGLTTNRPKFVQKQITQQSRDLPAKLNKKSFFNKTQNMNVTQKSFEKPGLKSQRRSEYKSKTPSPVKVAPSQNPNDKIIDQLFSMNKRKRKDGIVENLIQNLLKTEMDYESPRETIRQLNEEIVGLRFKNQRLQKEIAKLKQNKNLMAYEVLESLVMDVFELVMISKTIDNNDRFSSLINLLAEKSRTVMVKLNPLVGLFELEEKMKQNGAKLKDLIVNMTKSPKYNMNKLLKTINQDKALKPKVSDASTISRFPMSSSGLQDLSQGSDFVIQEEPMTINQEYISSGNRHLQSDYRSQQCENQISENASTVIYHHSKSNSYDAVQGVSATATIDFVGMNVNDLSLNKGDKVQVLKKTSSKWWIGMKDNLVGYFPAGNVSID